MAHKMQGHRKGLLCLHGVQRLDRTAMTLNKTSQEGLKDGWIRATFILRKDYLEKLKALAYWERKKIKEVVDEALRLYLRRRKTKTKTSN